MNRQSPRARSRPSAHPGQAPSFRRSIRGKRRRPPPALATNDAINFFFGRRAKDDDGGDDKHIIFLRHGTTEMNEYLHKQCSYYSPDFKDPLIFDTRLTRDGERRAREAVGKATALRPRPELIVASPLTRALQTAELAFAPLLDAGVPCLALPLARERLFLSSDVGREGAELAAEFPRWRESLLALEGRWWLHSPSSPSSSAGSGGSEGEQEQGQTTTTSTTTTTRRRRLRTPTPKPNPAVEEEGDDEFAARMDALGDWLSARPERCVAVVSHWGVILEATGHEFENVEMRAFRRAQLRL